VQYWRKFGNHGMHPRHVLSPGLQRHGRQQRMQRDNTIKGLKSVKSSQVRQMWTMSMVPLVFVLMRLYVRVYMRRVFGWDDGIAKERRPLRLPQLQCRHPSQTLSACTLAHTSASKRRPSTPRTVILRSVGERSGCRLMGVHISR
jgi:hypothetical protein